MKKTLVIVTILFLALGATSTTLAIMGPTTTAIPELSERAVLMALYNSTNGPGWTTSTGWGTVEPGMCQAM